MPYHQEKVHQKGFTLVEMIIVIAIIGILSGIGLVHYGNVRGMARDARRKSDLAYIRLALAMYFDDNSKYPATISNGGKGPDLSTDKPTGSIFSTDSNPLYPTYMSGVFVDPINNGGSENFYVYDTNENNNKEYVVCIHQESKNEEAKDWIAFYSSGGAENFEKCPNLPYP